MSFRSIVRDMRDSIGSLSRRSFEVILSGHPRGRSQSSVHQFQDNSFIIHHGQWASLPPELLRDVIKRLEQGDSTWPARRSVVACAGVCRAWRVMCKEIVATPEFSGKLTFPLSLKLPGPREDTIQCFIKRDKSSLTYRLFLSLTSSFADNGKFLLSAKRSRRTTYTEYVISMSADNISRSSNTYIGKLRSNFLGTKFIIYDSQPPQNAAAVPPPPPGRSRRFSSNKVSPKLPSSSFNIARVTYELNVLGTRGPRRMHCTMYTIPASAMAAGGDVPGQPEALLPPRALGESFNSSIFSNSVDFGSSRYFDDDDVDKGPATVAAAAPPLVLRNKAPRWHEQLQCWCLNFRGRVTVASVKNFQLIAETQAATMAATTATTTTTTTTAVEQEKIILQFGKVGKDMFTMDYRYPLSAFQAFAICLTSFDTKLACE
ncbi:tubby-like F-box protein 8 [Wolffia australiana]